MKVNFKWGIKTFSGFIDDMVYGSYLKKKVCISREYSYPELTDNNIQLGKCGKNLFSLWKSASALYKEDFKLYRRRFKKKGFPHNPALRKLCPSPYDFFVVMMFAWQKSDPLHIDIPTVTIENIVSSNADTRTVFRAIEAGFLKTVKPYDDLTKEIQV